MFKTARTFVFVASCFVLSSIAFAQEAQTGSTIDGGDRTAQMNDSTEGINTGRGGLFGIGGQKPMRRVAGIPLPARQNKLAANGIPGQSNVYRDSAPTFPMRRSKQMVGDLTTDFPARMVYLNGKNISSVREQQLNGVNVRIDAQGNLYISAPQYEVQESSHYRPLLPNEVPKVGKPSVSSEAPLFPGRFSKAAPLEKSEASAGAVPPISSEDGEAAEMAPVASAKAGAKDANPAQETAKPAGKAP